MQKMFLCSRALAGVFLMLASTNSICLAADAKTAATSATSPVQVPPRAAEEDGYAPMATNPNTGQPYRAPFLHGTFDSVSSTELIIKGRTHHEPITFLLKGTIPVYDPGRKHIALSDLKSGDHLKVHFQKNPDTTMTALAVYRVEN